MRSRSVISLAAMLLAMLAAGQVWAAPLLQVDVNDNDDTPGDNQPGFTSLLETDVGGGDSYSKIISGITVDIDGPGTAFLDDRHRGGPATTGTLTQAPIYRDFVFSATPGGNPAPNGSATINFSGLTPLSLYELVVWSFDEASTGPRQSLWSVTTGTGAPVSYTFDGATAPTTDLDRTFMMQATADVGGQIQFTGSVVSGGTAVFINGFQLSEVEVEAVPEPATLAFWSLMALAVAGCGVWRRAKVGR